MPKWKIKKYACYILCIFFTFLFSLRPIAQSLSSAGRQPVDASSQPFGLAFYNNEDVQDKRTCLDLNPGKAFCFHRNVDISFEFSFLRGHKNYFGYILRLVRNNTQNIDLLFDKVALSLGGFQGVVGDRPSFASFTLDTNRLFNSWNTLRLTIDFTHDRLLLYINKERFIQNGIGLSPSDSFRISFGACPIQQFKTTDVPPMKIRNIRISSDADALYHWPLDEERGALAQETVQGASGVVSNPLWIKSTHYEWKPADSLFIDGPASCAFDSRQGLLYLVGRDSLFVYNLVSGNIQGRPYTSGTQALLAGNQSVYAPLTRQLYNIYLDQQLAGTFDFTSGQWDRKYKTGDIYHWHLNKFYSASDTSIYMLNGYGHMRYNNAVFRYHIPTHTWDSIAVRGDSLIPRYLAAAGAAGDSVYIVGGYGSSSGQQILNPRNLYDMMRFDVRTKTFKKLFELSPVGEDFVFANSLVIDQPDRSYYGLTFNNAKYHSELQLIKGSLDGGTYQAVGDKIPYLFRDIESFADLYYSPAVNRFVAVVLFTDSTTAHPSRTQVHIYSLDGPPEPYVPEAVEAGSGPGGHSFVIVYILLSLLLVGGCLYFIFDKKKRKPRGPVRTTDTAVRTGDAIAAPGSADDPGDTREAAAKWGPSAIPADTRNKGAAIFLFGDMQVFDKEGGDLTKQFSPLLKELFLLILLNSLKNERGISSEKLSDTLWFDKSEKSARNNRSVNIAKLKGILDKTGGCNLSKETGYWKIDIQPELVRVDYLDYLAIIQNRTALDKNGVKALASITRRGSLLNNVEYPWLDPFKSDVSNHVIDTYLHFAHSGTASDDPEFMIGLADDIFYFDSVNEEAMVIKCRALVQLGKHSLAKSAYTSFVKEYRQIYGEDFGRDFQNVLNN